MMKLKNLLSYNKTKINDIKIKTINALKKEGLIVTEVETKIVKKEKKKK